MHKKILQKMIVTVILMVGLAITVQAARLPVVGEDTNGWGVVLNEYLQISHNSNGTLKDGVIASSIIADGSVTNAKIQDVDSSKVTGLSAFVVANELNPSNATIFIPSSQLTDIGDIQKAAPAFNAANFTFNYDGRTDRFGNANFTGLFSGAFDTSLATKSTTNLAEGTNLYFTNVRATDAMMAFHPTLDTSSLDDWNTANDTSSFNTLFATKSTSNLAEGSNLYYTDARFDTRLGTKSTTDLAEGTNFYFTNARAIAAVEGTGNTYVDSDVDTALALKADVASPTFTGIVSGITKSMVGLENVDNTADTAKPVSTAQQAALDLKANLANPTFTGTVSGITATMVGLGSVTNDAQLKAADLDTTTALGTSDTKIPSQNAVKTYVDTETTARATADTALTTSVGTKVTANSAITGATNTKITYDAKGLVTAGAAATTADIAASTDKNYVTDAQQTVLAATSGVNTGDQTLVSLGAVPITRTVNGHALSADVTVTKSDVGLGNVDDTSDANKPISTATQSALDLKAPLASPTFTGTVSGVTKSMVGLGNVDNTADTAKPISTAQQAALDLKANLASPTFTGTVGGITKSMVGLGNVDNTADSAKPVSTAQQTALDLKSDITYVDAADTALQSNIDAQAAAGFNSANFTALYDGRNDRFSNGNFTPLFAGSYDARVDRFGNSNFTLLFPASYDARTDRFGNTNFTALLSAGSINTDQVNGLAAFVVANELNPSNATLQINTNQVTGLAGFVQANELNPSNATIEIGTSQVIGLSSFVQANELNPSNATIQIGTGQVTGLQAFVVANELNPSNATIFIPSSQLTDVNALQKADSAFNAANFTATYDARTDRFGNDNFTALLSAGSINTSQVNGLAAFVVANELNPSNATLQINTNQVTGLAGFVQANELNPSNATIFIPSSQLTDIGDIQKAAPAFNAANFTFNYDGRTDRFGNDNFTLLFPASYDARTDRFGNDNFTALFPASYDARTDRFSNENFSTRLTGSMIDPTQIIDLTNYIRSKELNPSNATIQIGTLQVTGLAAFFAGEYDARADRFGNENFTTSFQSEVPLCAGTDKLTSSDGNTIICAADESGANLGAYNLGNFTSHYDARADRFGNGNFTSLLTAATGVSVQAFDVDLSDLADGSLTGTKVSPDFGSQNIVTTGTLTVGTNGTAITKHLSGTGSVDFVAYPAGGGAGACQQFNISVIGTVTGDSIAVSPTPVEGGVETYPGIIWAGWATTGIVTVRACNVAAATADIALQTWRADVWQH